MIWIGARSGEVQDGGQGDGDAGFTLLELVAALTILAVGIVGVIGVTNSSMNVAITTSARSKATALATKKIEDFRATPYDILEVKAYPDETPKVGGRTYRVQSWVDYRAVGALVNAYKAALALVERLNELVDLRVDTTDLEIASAAYERQVNDMLEGEDEVVDYVRRLEEDSDDEDDESEPFVIPSTDQLAAEVERYLRDQRGNSG